MKPNKNGECEKFFFEAYKRIVKEGFTTSIHTICIELILHRIKPKLQNPKRKATKQPQSKRILQRSRFDESKNEAHMMKMAEKAKLANYR